MFVFSFWPEILFYNYVVIADSEPAESLPSPAGS